MWNSIQQTALTIVAIACLASGMACQTHVVLVAGPAQAADHAAAGHGHHGAGHANAPIPENPDTCCVPRLADTPSASADSIPHAVPMAFAAVDPGRSFPLHPAQAPTYKPPGRHPPLDQTSVLLI